VRNSVSVPTDWPMQRMVIRPFPAGPTFMIDVIVLGAFGAQACQAANIRAACDCDRFQETPNTSAVCSGKARITNWVATPKLPPPPPRHAQYRSGSELALACNVRAWLSMTVTC
jgi:hypothetical protein